MTDDDTRTLARALMQMGRSQLEAGDLEGAKKTFERADELLHASQLDSKRLSVQADSMIDARSQAIAVKAAGKNKLLQAISGDPRWGSATRYCRQRLKISPGSLTGYMAGTTPVPQHVVKKVAADFPGLSWTWKKIAD